MIMYISKSFQGNIGATMHYRALTELVGAENVFTINLQPEKKSKKKNYIAYGKYKNYVDRLIRWFQGNMMFISNTIINEICIIIEQQKIRTVFIEDSVFGNLVRQIKTKHPDVRVISFYHDIKANLYRQWRVHEKLVNKIEFSIGIKQELVNQKYADMNLTFNQRDADLFKKYYGKEPEGVIALPAPIPVPSPQANKRVVNENESKELLFVGKKYLPNIIGLRWFAKEVLPFLNENITINVVGRGLECMREKLIDPRFHVIGGVDSLDEYYRNSDIVIAPLFDGGGMKSKTVEALSYGKVFVGTKESLFGFWEVMGDRVRNHMVYQVDQAKAWIDTLNMLIESKIAKFNLEEYELFLNEFSYETAKRKLSHFILEDI